MLRRLALLVLSLLIAGPASLAWAGGGSVVRVQVVDERGVPLRDAVVELHSRAQARGRITFPWRMAMAQRNEAFVPQTLVVAKGSTVAFPNLDRVRHSVYSFSKAARFEFELYGRDQTRSQAFPIAGAVSIGCNIHDQMRGYIRVVDTPFAAKTDHNGYAVLEGVPSGMARVTVWHPRLRAPGGELTRELAVSGANPRLRMGVRLR